MLERDYSTLLGRAKTIREHGGGYIYGREKMAVEAIEIAFKKDVNAMTYILLKDTDSATLARSTVAQDLAQWSAKLEQSNADFDWQSNVEFVREALFRRIDVESVKNSGTRTAQHMVRRTPDLFRIATLLVIGATMVMGLIEYFSQ